MEKINFKMITLKAEGMMLTLFCIMLFSGCDDRKESTVKVNFSNTAEVVKIKSEVDSVKPLRVAVAAIISPRETYSYYNDLFRYISVKIDRPIVFEQRKTYSEVNNMLLNQSVDIAFICTGAYIRNKSYCNILVVPVCKGITYYQGYIITNKSSSIGNFDKLKGKTFAFTDPLSNTGKLFPEIKVKKNYNLKTEEFFSKVIYTNAHDISIELVSKNIVDGASVNSLIFDYFEAFNPEKIKNIKIIDKSGYFGIPPIVTSKGIDPDLRKKLEELFLKVHKDPEGAVILKKLMIDRFVLSGDTLYNDICSEYKESGYE